MCQIGDFVRLENVPKERPWKGWRRWRVHHGVLHSLVYNHRWNSLPKKADRAPTGHDSRELFNNHGIWAHSRRPLRNSRILGQVLMWGPTAIHRRGRRSLWCKIISLSDPKLAKKYGVEVCK